MLRSLQDVRGMARGLSDNLVVLCKVRLAGTWIKRTEGVVGARRIRYEKLREDRYREGYTRSLERKRVEGDGDYNVEHMWEQVKWAIVKHGSVRVGGRTQRVVGR